MAARTSEGGRLATGAMLAYLVVLGAAAAARINLAVDRGRNDLDVAAIVPAFGLAALTVAATGMSLPWSPTSKARMTRAQSAERARSTPTGPSHAAFT